MYHITCPTLTDGAVASHPVGIAEPVVGVVNVGVELDWLCTLYALIKLNPFKPAVPEPVGPVAPVGPLAATGVQANGELTALMAEDEISL